MEFLIEKLRKISIVPVIAINDAKDAVPLAKALIEGGIPCAEVTFRTAAAADAIKAIKQSYPEMLVGAGTVLTTEQVDAAKTSGADFIVAPGLNPDTVKYCQSVNIPMIPGVMTPSEIECALSLGLDMLKFFPAEAAGGLKMIKAMCAPYKSVRFMPTGGINENNICDYLAYDKIVACGGSWMVPSSDIAEGNFDKIKAACQTAMAKIKEVR